MQALKLNEVLLRVVAWHNRHPLARRIGPSQVHSIGEVLLPFASAQPLGGALATPPAPPELARWAPRPLPGGAAAKPPPHPAPAPTQALPGPNVDTLLPGDAAADADAAAAERAAEADAADFDPFAPDAVDAAAAEPAPASNHPVALPEEPPARPGDALPGVADALPAPAADHAAAADAARPGRVQRLLARLRTALTGRRPGLPRLKPAFSRDFIWPLTPRQVARWAQSHGETQALTPADWPRRTVDSDPAQLAGLRQKGLAHSVQLHVLTAAIGVGDRRIRVLMDAHGAIIGPRAYSRPRQASAAVLLAAVVLGAGWGLRPAAVRSAADAAVLAAVAASAAEAAAATAAAGSAAAAAAGPASAAALAAVAPASSVGHDNLRATVPTTAAAPQPASPAATTSAAPAAAAPLPAQTRHANAARGHAAQAVPAAQPVAAPEVQAAVESAPPAPRPDPAAPLGRIRPALSVEQRQAARQQAAELRAANPPAPRAAPAAPTAPAPVYAVVTRPNPLRETAAQGLALMRATSPRLPPPTPSRGELMQNQGQWRAAWWPFASLADAERARVMLAGRGLKAEVVEF